MTKKETLALEVGTKVWCTVRAVAGWYSVCDIRQRDGYIKINSGHNVWCPPHNFSFTDDQGLSFEVSRQ